MLSKFRYAAQPRRLPAWSFALALLALTFLAYGLRALSLGLYWDDWPYLWLFQRLGAEGVVQALSEDRPFLSFLYTTSFRLLGPSPAAWQIYAIVWRWLCSLAFWGMLVQAWPAQKHKTAWAAALFAVYPGFTQQWVAMIYGQAFALYTPVFASIAITLWLARRSPGLPRWQVVLASAGALALSAFSMFSTEYFFGLELLRPLLLVLVFSGASRSAFRSGLLRAFRWWLPYLALMVLFVIWRAFLQVFPGHSLTVVEGLEKNFLRQLFALALTILDDLLEATVAAWGQVLNLASRLEGNPAAGLRTLLVIAITALAAWGFLQQLRPTARDDAQNWAGQALLVGVLALLVGGWPFWITGLPMRLGFPQDRYTLPLAPGAALLLAGGIDWLGGKSGRKTAAVALLVGLAAGFHNTTALLYRAEWNALRAMFWQLTWRAPALQPGTLLVVDGLPFRLYEDDSLLGPLNWTYDPDGHSDQMPLALFDVQVRFQNLAELGPGVPLVKDYRGVQFNGSTDRVIVLAHASGGCWSMLDPQYDSDNYQLSDGLLRVLPYSQPGALVLADVPAAQPPREIFGPQPDPNWCYYFARAGLARQQQDWAAIYALGEESIDRGVRPQQPVEYLPFVEGYLRYGLPDDAYQLTLDAYNQQYALRPALCAVWQRAQQAGMLITDANRAALRIKPGCALAEAPE